MKSDAAGYIISAIFLIKMRFGKVPPALCGGKRLYVSGTAERCRIKVYSPDKKVAYCDHVHTLEDLTKYYSSSPAAGACPKCAIIKNGRPDPMKVGQWWDWDPLDFLNPREDVEDDEEIDDVESPNDYALELKKILAEYLNSTASLRWKFFFKDEYSNLYAIPDNYIGKGGQGVVYQGWQITPTFKSFAFKEVCKSDTKINGFEDIRECLKKVILEMSIMQKISDLGCLHNLACLRDIHVVLDFYSPGRTVWIYIVQDFIDGVNMENLNRPLSVDEFTHLAISLFEALAYLHGIGFAHTDIFPTNIMATLSPKNEIVAYHLIDFGMAIDRFHKWGGHWPLETKQKDDVWQAINALINAISLQPNPEKRDLYLEMTRDRDLFTREAKKYATTTAVNIIIDTNFDKKKMTAMEILEKLDPEKAKQVKKDLQIAQEK